MKRMMISIVGILFVISGLAAGESKATIYDLKYVINGYTGIDPAGYFTAEFTTIETGVVNLKLTSNLPADSYFWDAVAFNIDPAIVPDSLGFSVVGTSGSFSTPTFIKALTQQSSAADPSDLSIQGGGNYAKGFDFIVSFITSDGTPTRFGNNDSITYQLTGTGITENSFAFLNQYQTYGVSNVAAHLQGIPDGMGGTTSSLVSNVPIPAAAWLLGSGLLGLVVVRRRNKK